MSTLPVGSRGLPARFERRFCDVAGCRHGGRGRGCRPCDRGSRRIASAQARLTAHGHALHGRRRMDNLRLGRSGWGSTPASVTWLGRLWHPDLYPPSFRHISGIGDGGHSPFAWRLLSMRVPSDDNEAAKMPVLQSTSLTIGPICRRIATSAAVCAAAMTVASCTTTLPDLSSQMGGMPSQMGGLPRGTPERPATPPAYPAVHDMPPPRASAVLTEERRRRLEAELRRVCAPTGRPDARRKAGPTDRAIAD